MDLTRQYDLVSEKILDTPIFMVGAGGIGSPTALALAKTGFKSIEVFDDDMVEEHNIPNQLYRTSDIGGLKVTALYDIVKAYTNTTIAVTDVRWDKSLEIQQPVVISAVDSMSVRKELFKHCKNNTNVKYFIDGRMGGHQLEIYSVDMRNDEDKRRYHHKLWAENEASVIPCTSKATMYMVFTIASWITNQVRLLLSDKEYKRELILDMENMIFVGS